MIMKIENLIPVFAPAPPAVIIGLQLYHEVLKAASDEWWLLAGFAAILGMVGTIGAEMLAYKQALRALAEREILPAIIAAIGALAASALIVWTIWRGEDSRPLVVAVVVAIIAYLINGVNAYIQEKRTRRQSVQDNSIRQIEAQAALEKERAKTAAAHARQAKFESGQGGDAVRAVREQSRTAPNRLDADLLARVRAYLKAHPEAGPRELQRELNIKSSSTAAKYRDAVN